MTDHPCHSLGLRCRCRKWLCRNGQAFQWFFLIYIVQYVVYVPDNEILRLAGDVG